MSADVVWNVPQVHGKSSDFWEELMEGVEELECGKERFCTRRYLPGLPDLGTRDKGDDWKGPISCSNSLREKGPI